MNFTFIFPVFRFNFYFHMKKVIRHIEKYIGCIKNNGGNVFVGNDIDHVNIYQKAEDTGSAKPVNSAKPAQSKAEASKPDNQSQQPMAQQTEEPALLQTKTAEPARVETIVSQSLPEETLQEPQSESFAATPRCNIPESDITSTGVPQTDKQEYFAQVSEDLNEEGGMEEIQVPTDCQDIPESNEQIENQGFVKSQARLENETEVAFPEAKDEALRDLSLYIDNKELLYYYALKLNKCLYTKDIAKVAVAMARDENIECIDSETAVKARFFNLLVPLCPNIRKKTGDSNLRYYINEELAKKAR